MVDDDVTATALEGRMGSGEEWWMWIATAMRNQLLAVITLQSLCLALVALGMFITARRGRRVTLKLREVERANTKLLRELQQSNSVSSRLQALVDEYHMRLAEKEKEAANNLLESEEVRKLQQAEVNLNNRRLAVVSKINSFSDSGGFEHALELITNGTGSTEQSIEIVPQLLQILIERRLADAEQIAKRALETNKYEDLLAIGDDVQTPSVIQAKLRLRIMVLNTRLCDAMEARDENALAEALIAARQFNADMSGSSAKGNNDPVAEVPWETIQQSEQLLASIATKLESVVLCQNSKECPAKLTELLAEEMWNWQPVAVSPAPDPDHYNNLDTALQLLATHDCRLELERALELGDFVLLKETVHAFRLRGVRLVDLEKAELIVKLRETRRQLAEALEAQDEEALDCVLVASAGLPKLLKDAEAEEKDQHEAPLLNTDNSKNINSLAQLLRCELDLYIPEIENAKRQSVVLSLFRVLSHAVAKNSMPDLRQAIQEYQTQMILNPWLEKSELFYHAWDQLEQTSALHQLEQAQRMLAAAPTVELKQRLFQSAVLLHQAEKAGVPLLHELFVSIQQSHTALLVTYVQDHFGIDRSIVMALINLGVSRIDDLHLIGEGDLRQAGMSRLAARKSLPSLVALGDEACSTLSAVGRPFASKDL